MALDQNNAARKTRGRYKKDYNKPRIMPFIKNLCRLIEDPLADRIISWDDSDTCGFVTIHDSYALESTLLAKYFKHSNLYSFTRQLNLHGFHKLFKTRTSNPTEEQVFMNKYFMKSQPQLLSSINKAKPTEKKKTVSNRKDTLIRSIERMQAKLDYSMQDPSLRLLQVMAHPALRVYSPVLKMGAQLLAHQSLQSMSSRISAIHKHILDLCLKFTGELNKVLNLPLVSTQATVMVTPVQSQLNENTEGINADHKEEKTETVHCMEGQDVTKNRPPCNLSFELTFGR